MISKKFLRLVSGNKRNPKLKVGKKYKMICIALAVVMFFEAIQPQSLYGLTAGPKSPEFATFTPVAASDMVNLATGDFSYNIPVIEIPGPDGAGYALSLNYNSGVNPEQEASWVGFGWNLNPGAINRDTRGIPDDYNGQIIEKYNKSRPNYTVGVSNHTSFEIMSKDLPVPEDKIPIGGLSAVNALRFNNYRGYSKTVGFGLNFMGLSANINIDQAGERTYSADINIFQLLKTSLKLHANNLYTKVKNSKNADEQKSLQHKLDVTNKQNKIIKWCDKLVGNVMSAGSYYGYYTTDQWTQFNPAFTKYYGLSINTTLLNFQINPTVLPIGIEVGLDANFNVQFNKYYNKYQAYGFLH